MKGSMLEDFIQSIRDYPRDYEEGFTRDEMVKIILSVEGLEPSDIFERMGVVTGIVKDGEFLYYEDDFILGVRLYFGNRGMKSYEFD